MPEAIGPLSGPAGLGALSRLGARPDARGAAAGGPGFGQSLGELVARVDEVQKEAAEAIHGVAAGDGENLHEVMLAVNKAELSFTFLMEARNKLVEAYQEVMRMSI